MKKLEDSSDAHVNATHTHDPTKKSQRNGSKKKHLKLKSQQDSKKSDEKKSCIWCKGDIHSREKCPAKHATCKLCGKEERESSSFHEVTGKVDTGAMVSCMPISMLSQIGLSKKDLKPSNAVIRGMSGADLQNCGTVDVNVTCNDITSMTKFYVTKREQPGILFANLKRFTENIN